MLNFVIIRYAHKQNWHMTKYTALIVLGFLVALLPFLGFPPSWERALFALFGFGIMILAFLLRKELVSYVSQYGPQKGKKTDVFVENGAHLVPPIPPQPPRMNARTSQKIQPVDLDNGKD